jgi:hypothetical protein
VGALFAKKRFGRRTPPDAVELALDLTAEAITLHERARHGAWKKFAAAQLDDSEFPIVIGLLRNEVETHAGGRRPVRLWLPGEQILKLQARIEGENPAERLHATFDYIDRETVYRRQDVAVAVAPANRNGETTVLITFAETWREARDYAARWGFLPGDVSTRHHSGDFGADGPVFHVHAPAPDTPAPIRRSPLISAGLALIAIVAGTAAWSLKPWETPPGLPGPAPGTVIEVAEASTPPPAPEAVTTAPLPAPTPDIRAEALPPRHFPNIPALAPSGIPGDPPKIDTARYALASLATPNALESPNAMAAAPSPPPNLEPAPLAHDPVITWTGPLPELTPSEPQSPPAAPEIAGLTDAPIRAESIILLASNAAPLQAPPAAPAVEPPTIEPATIEPAPTEPVAITADAAETIEVTAAPLPVPIPIPRPTRSVPVAEVPDTASDPETAPESPLAKILPPPRPARLGQPETEPAETIAAATPDPGPTGSPDASAALAPADGATTTPEQTENPDAPSIFASLTAPLPKTRPALPALRRNLPSVTAMPPLTGAARRSIEAAATEPGLPLDRTSLIGIFNIDTGRKALLRLPNGHYRAVIVGDVLDGWRVSLIGADAMRITRNGKDVTLLLVNR